MEAQEKPTAAFVLSFIGGTIILIGGTLEFIGALAASVVVSSLFGAPVGGLWVLLGVLGLICGILVVVGAVMLYVNPKRNVPWGVITIIFSVISLLFAYFGGFVAGMILGIIGGALGIAWKPLPPLGPAPTPITRVCP
jgi:hypothetical protein